MVVLLRFVYSVIFLAMAAVVTHASMQENLFQIPKIHLLLI